MRKILLATTALVGFAVAGAAQAATSPLNVTVGGSTDFIAGGYHESAKAFAPANDLSSHDFETIYDLNFGVTGKAGNGLEYGGNLSLNNDPDIANGFHGDTYNVNVNQADIFMSGAFGKVQLGDSHGATDLAVTAPTVGEGQTQGRYIDFLDTQEFAKNLVLGVDSTDHSTNVTYFTPKVGNDMNKVQLGFSYVPEFYNYGSSVTQINNSAVANATGTGNSLSPYKDVVKGAAAYTGTFNPVTLGLSADVITGSANTLSNGQAWIVNAPTGKVRDFTSWDVGAKAAMAGWTAGAGYSDLGHYDTVGPQNNQQHTYTAGVKYEFNKVAVGVNYLGGEGYGNMLASPAGGGVVTSSNFNYVHDFNSYGAGGTYTWAPGLTTNLDGVIYSQEMDSAKENDGYVLLVSQKLAF
jgi:Gram-negative porin